MKCFNCKKECGDHYYTCDQSESLDDAWCLECFEKTECGREEHGEGCMTLVVKLPNTKAQPQP